MREGGRAGIRACFYLSDGLHEVCCFLVMVVLGHEAQLLDGSHQHVQALEGRNSGLQVALGQIELLDVAEGGGEGGREGRRAKCTGNDPIRVELNSGMSR